jgi:hypothetical protein
MVWNSRVLLAAGLLVFASVSVAQTTVDKGPDVIPPPPHSVPASKPVPVPVHATAPLLVTCDLPCKWSLDGTAQGILPAGGTAKARVNEGQHFVAATATDGVEHQQKDITVVANHQVVVHLELQPQEVARTDGRKPVPPPPDLGHREPTPIPPPPETKRQPPPPASDRFDEAQSLVVEKRYSEARPLLEQSCARGNQDGCAWLGALYRDGTGVAKNNIKARELFQKSCDANSMRGCYGLATLYGNGQGVPTDYKRARQLLEKSCSGGDQKGCTGLGWMLQNGMGGEPDYDRALQLLDTSCRSGEMMGCNNLAGLYGSGHGVPKDDAHARQLYKQACDGGEMKACYNLGQYMHAGLGGPIDPLTAHALYRKACEAGVKEGCSADMLL